MNTSKQGFSIIMTVYDQAHELKENLPAYSESIHHLPSKTEQTVCTPEDGL